MVSILATELRVALRRMARAPVFVLAVVLVLSLGLGANLIISNAAYAVLWRPLSFPQPEHLVTLRSENTKGVVRTVTVVTGGQAGLLADEVASLAQVGLVKHEPAMAVSLENETLDWTAAGVNSGYLRALGLQPLAGRLFSDEEDAGTGVEARGLLTEAAWQKYFRGDPGIVGQLLSYQTGARRSQLRIVGIVRKTAALPFAGDPDVLLSVPWRNEGVRNNFNDARYRCVLRTKPDVALNRVSMEIQQAFDSIGGKAAGERRNSYTAIPLRTALAPSNTTATLMLWGAAGLLLLLTCANLAGLILARSTARLQDSSVRLALGASWRHLLLNNLAESALLCLAGTLFAFWLSNLCGTWMPALFPDLRSFGPDHLASGPVLAAFGGILCAAVALVIALPASLHMMTTRVAGALSQHSGGRVTRRNRWTLFLVTAQISVVLTLLTAGGLVERSFLAALRTDPGFESEGAVTFRVSIPSSRDALPAAASDLARVIATIPGTSGASFAATPPLGSNWRTSMSSRAGQFAADDPHIGFRRIGAGYFETLGARLSAGRAFTEEEVRRGDEKMILNESAARILFSDTEAVGRAVHTAFGGMNCTVVGIVNDIRHEALDRTPGPMA